MNLSESLQSFYRSFLDALNSDPAWEGFITPPADNFRLFGKYSDRYYSSDTERTLIVGINPGRKGSGETGVPFVSGELLTDSGFENPFKGSNDLSSKFFGYLINSYGGFERFHSEFILSAAFPIGLSVSGKNANYYDFPKISGWPELIELSLEKHRALPNISDKLIVVGKGKNYDVLFEINSRRKLFSQICAVDHPRFIMQYNRSKIDFFIASYENALRAEAA